MSLPIPPLTNAPVAAPQDGKSSSLNEPKQIVIKDRIIKDWWCPHCNNEIGEKSLHPLINEDGSPDPTIEKHTCGGYLTRPPRSPGEEAEWQAFRTNLGLTEAIQPFYHKSGDHLILVNESLPKSVRERLHRRTRKVKGISSRHIAPVIKRDADNDPRQTSRGRANFRGSRKARQDAGKRMDQFDEAIDFININVNKTMDVVVEAASKLDDPVAAVTLIDKLLAGSDHHVSKEWLASTRSSIMSILEGRPIKFGPILAKLDDPISESKAREMCEDMVRKMGTFMPNVRVERITDPRVMISKYAVIER